MKKRFVCLSACAISLAMAASYSSAASAHVICSGKIQYVLFEPAGYVMAGIGYGHWSICNLDADTNVTAGPYGPRTISPETCKAYLSTLLTAKAQQSEVTFYFDNATSCPTTRDLTADYPYAIRFDD